MKGCWLALWLAASSAAAAAEPPDPCAALTGPALGQCLADQQKRQRQQLAQQQEQLARQQEQLAQQLGQLQQQQQQLAQQQQQLMQQQEQLARQQQEFAHQRQEQQALKPAAAQAAEPAATADAKRRELESWKAENPWYGSDYARTQLAMRYARQLQHDRPDLTGRPFLDALSAKVRETFGDAR